MDDLTKSFPIINNRYQIFRTIATGGMAVVYEAQDLFLERKVALKILKRELSKDQAFQNKFRLEAKSSANLNHSNIISTYDFGFDQDHLYIVMEYIDGTDLKEWINSRKSVNLSDARNYLIQAAEGLSYAHEAGIIHCDVKPQNMLIGNQGILKITDFGVARAIETISRDEIYSEVWGSPFYISPEQSRGEPPTTQSDVYALGVIAYELMTDELPFTSNEASDLLRMHRLQEPIPPVLVNPDIKNEMNKFILRSLSKDPLLRPCDAKESLALLLNMRPSIIEDQKNDLEAIEVESFAYEHKVPMDFGSIILSLLALIMAGGLIPFWIYVLFSIKFFGR
jgi:serine/threonine-protein kinase